MYPEKPKRGSDADSQRTIDFVSPSPIEGCITILKRQAYDVWGDRVRLHMDSITPDEWVIQVFEPPKQGGQVMLVEGRLMSEESGATRVMLREVSAPSSARTLPVLLTMLIGVAVVLLIRRTDILTLMTLVAYGFLMVMAILKFPNVSLPHPKVKVVIEDIEHLLKR